MNAESKIIFSLADCVGDSSGHKELSAPSINTSELPLESSRETETLKHLLASNQEMIQQLTRRLAGMEDGRNFGVKGIPDSSPKQQAVQKELDEARTRYKEVLKRVAESR